MNDAISTYETNRIYQIRGDIMLPGELRIFIYPAEEIIMQELLTGYRANMQDFP